MSTVNPVVLLTEMRNFYCSFLGVGAKRQWINDSLLCVFACVYEFVKDKSHRDRPFDDDNLVGVTEFVRLYFLPEEC